jgi:hypothetical protein
MVINAAFIRMRVKRLKKKLKGKKRTVGTTILVKRKSLRGRQRVRKMRNNVEDPCSEEKMVKKKKLKSIIGRLEIEDYQKSRRWLK